MTSLNAFGFSLSILNLTRVKHTLKRDNLTFDPLDLLDDPTEAAAWVGVKSFWSAKGSRERKLTREDNATSPEVLNVPSESPNDDTDRDIWSTISPVSVKNAITGACQAILAAEEELNGLDAVVGDGDCGTTFSAGAKGLFDSA
jgi:triose/dihydroxyacetone kinase / FAD-AMP lyase (cyclizing)